MLELIENNCKYFMNSAFAEEQENTNYLNKIHEYREKIYDLINEYLNPHNSSPLAQELQNSLNSIRLEQTTNSTKTNLYALKARKAKILETFIEKIFSHAAEFELQFKNPPTLSDKKWTKKLLVYDFLYYGPVTLIAIPEIMSRDEDLSQNPVYEMVKEELADLIITEIRINNYQNIFIETNKKTIKWNLSFLSEEQLQNVIQRIISESNLEFNSYTRINNSSPIADFEHPCGFIRGSAVIPPASQDALLTLRIHPKQAYKLDDLEDFGMLDTKIKDFFIAIQKAGTTIAIAGTMGSGKTTLLSALAEYWPDNGRKATIEDTPELNPEIDDLVKFRTTEFETESSLNINVAKLTKACKRHSVKYVVLSEARDGSAWDILQLSQTILGTLLTFHYTLRTNKNQVDQALNTLAALCKQSPIAPRGEDLKHLIASMIQILVLVEQSPVDNKRRITKIYYINGFDEMNGGHFKYIELFSHAGGSGFKQVSICPEFEEYLRTKGVEYSFS